MELEHGKTLYVTLNAVGEVDQSGNRDVIFDVRHSHCRHLHPT